MQDYRGLKLPDGEKHLIEWMDKAGELLDGKPTYQIKKYRKALEYVTNFDCALDIGAHAGLWSRVMQRDFLTLYAFEPVPAHQECWRENVSPDNATLLTCALGAEPGTVRIGTPDPASTGDTFVVDEGGVLAEICTLDSFDFDNVGFMKIDCEGYELNVLKGGEQTIRNSKPVIIVEQKPGKAQHFGLGQTDAVEWLTERGYVVREVMSGDYILTCP